MEKFKVGQEYVVLEPYSLGVDGDYERSDTFTVCKVYGECCACDKFWNIFILDNVDDGFIKLIKDAPEEQPKLTPRNLACFEEVAKVIGEEGAEKELQEVIDVDPDIIGETFDKPLDEAFTWSKSPQGYKFWRLIDDNKPPKGYVHESSIPTMKEVYENLRDSRESGKTPQRINVNKDYGTYSSNHYNLNYSITDEDIERGYIRVDAYFVNKTWGLNSKDDTGILFHQLKTVARFGDKNPIEREIKAMYGQVKRMAEMYNVELED